MSAPALEVRTPAKAQAVFLGVTVLLAAVIGLAAISAQSFWIDEALSAVKARQPSFSAWAQVMLQEKASDLQMPFYMFYLWAYEKLFGSSEWSLRSANLPWFILGVVAFIHSFGAQPNGRRLAVFVALTCPFGWYYLSEARPYAMQLGAAFLIMAALRHLSNTPPVSIAAERAWLGWFLFGVLVLSGSSLLGMIWAAAALAALPLLRPDGSWLKLIRPPMHWCVLAATVFLILGAYYLWTLGQGARASAAAGTSLANVFYIAYELLGFSGLGPGRGEMRTGNLEVFKPYWPWLLLYAGLIGTILGAGFIEARRWCPRKFHWLTLLAGIPGVIILTTGFVAHFRVLGRHFTPLLPTFLLILSLGLVRLWSARPWTKVAVLLYCGLSVQSCLALRFSPRHERDDYRAAALLAKSAVAQGQTVWWNAAEAGAAYYRLPLVSASSDLSSRGLDSASPPVGRSDRTDGAALFLMNPPRDLLEKITAPQVIIASKPDIYDGQMSVADFVRSHNFRRVQQLTGFQVWTAVSQSQ